MTCKTKNAHRDDSRHLPPNEENSTYPTKYRIIKFGVTSVQRMCSQAIELKKQR